ncbi:MAG TPA: tyrosine-type recombinase/integrase [Propionibacteriaceae bacterium]|nr:tyrosine-type recombinase/integrase [Propionibacteriaceae bacterium]
MHDLRHAHASWLIASGGDLRDVMERMGHAQIQTTQKYLHTLPDRDKEPRRLHSRRRSTLRNPRQQLRAAGRPFWRTTTDGSAHRTKRLDVLPQV